MSGRLRQKPACLIVPPLRRIECAEGSLRQRHALCRRLLPVDNSLMHILRHPLRIQIKRAEDELRLRLAGGSQRGKHGMGGGKILLRAGGSGMLQLLTQLAVVSGDELREGLTDGFHVITPGD